MEIIYPDTGPTINQPTVAVVGTFDGLHLGHQFIINQALEAAGREKLPTVVVTFDQHPKAYFNPDDPPEILTTLDAKLRLLEDFGVDYAMVLEFADIAPLMPVEFAELILAGEAKAAHVFVGANFRFGAGAMGAPAALKELGAQLEFEVTEVPLHAVGDAIVSSTRIRELWAAGRVDEIPALLGRHHFITGTVIRESGRGIDLGYPTANLKLDEGLRLPKRGIYAGRLRVGKLWHAAAVSVGSNPTFGRGFTHCEVHALDFAQDIYGQAVAVELQSKLRDEKRFPSPQALADQIKLDVERTRRWFEAR